MMTFERDSGFSETSERDHVHICSACGDAWRHANDECQEPSDTPLPIAWVRRTWALCPLHEVRSDSSDSLEGER